MKLPPWSHSSLNQYKTCPAQYEALRISKRFPREDSEASIWGTFVHEAFEQYIKENTPLPERMKQYESFLKSLTIGYGACDTYSELELGIFEDGSPCDFNDPDCWARGIADFLRTKDTTAVCIDFKTGKRREGSSQLKMMAGLVLCNFPAVNRVVTGYAWLQEGGKISREEYKREDISKIWASFAKDLKELAWSYETGNWPTRPSGLCGKWCSVIDCAFNGRRVK